MPSFDDTSFVSTSNDDAVGSRYDLNSPRKGLRKRVPVFPTPVLTNYIDIPDLIVDGEATTSPDQVACFNAYCAMADSADEITNGYRKLVVALVKWSPGWAKLLRMQDPDYIANPTPVDEKRIVELAKKRETNEYQQTHQGFAITLDRRMSDGKHRSIEIERNGGSLITMITFGVSSSTETFAAMDDRNAGRDEIDLINERAASAGVLNGDIRLPARRLFARGSFLIQSPYISTPSPTMVVDRVFEQITDPKIKTAIDLAYDKDGGLKEYPQACMIFNRLVLGGSSETKLKAFWVGMRTGDDINGVRNSVRGFMLSQPVIGKRRAMSTRSAVFALIQAWNLWLKDGDGATYKVAKGKEKGAIKKKAYDQKVFVPKSGKSTSFQSFK